MEGRRRVLVGGGAVAVFESNADGGTECDVVPPFELREQRRRGRGNEVFTNGAARRALLKACVRACGLLQVVN